MKRHEAREVVIELVYETLIRHDDTSIVVQSYEDINGINIDEFAIKLYNGIFEKKDLIDELIEKYSISWNIGRISIIVRSILMLSVYEILFSDTPPKVAINEAIELSKSYGEEGSYRFVNGILNKLVKEEKIV